MSDYEIGYKKPPLGSRFQPGNQEWRKREAKRKKRSEFSPGNDFQAVLSSTIPVRRKNGRVEQKTRLRTIVEKLREAALQGDVSAANDLLSFRLNAEETGELGDLIIVFEQPGDEGV